MNPVVHFELPDDAAARASRFYETAFGSRMTSLGEEMGNDVTATRPRPTAPDRRSPARSTAASSRASPTGRRSTHPWSSPSTTSAPA